MRIPDPLIDTRCHLKHTLHKFTEWSVAQYALGTI